MYHYDLEMQYRLFTSTCDDLHFQRKAAADARQARTALAAHHHASLFVTLQTLLARILQRADGATIT